MTYLNLTNTELNFDKNYFDVFGRLQTSTALKVFEYFGEYGDLDKKFDNLFSGTASISSTDNYRTIDLNIGTAQGDRCTRQSSRYMRYIPRTRNTINVHRCFRTF